MREGKGNLNGRKQCPGAVLCLLTGFNVGIMACFTIIRVFHSLIRN